MKKVLIFLLSSIIFAAATISWTLHSQFTKASEQVIEPFATALPASPTPQLAAVVTPNPTPTPATTPTPIVLPEQALLSVPYTLQAPFNKWDPLHEDACEEASLIMLKHFKDGSAIGTPEQVDKEISDLVHWEEQHGYGLSITLEQLNQIAKDYYGLNGKVVQISSIEEVKQIIAKGQPIILGMAGKLLGNPNFKNGGPNYHMLVAKGYDATGIITNEPGTWHGNGYHYNYEPFYDSIHNWNSQNILNGAKAYLVFE